MKRIDHLIKKQRAILAALYVANKCDNHHQYSVPLHYPVPQKVADDLWIDYQKICDEIATLTLDEIKEYWDRK